MKIVYLSVLRLFGSAMLRATEYCKAKMLDTISLLQSCYLIASYNFVYYEFPFKYRSTHWVSKGKLFFICTNLQNMYICK